MKRTVVLLSGGIDSTVCATLAAHEYGNESVFGLSILYGQKHEREVKAARRIAHALELGRHDIITLEDTFQGGGSALVDEGIEVPETTYQQVREAYGPSPMYVPFRNGVLLSHATAYAMTVKADKIFYGAHAEDARNFAYPDTTPEFNGSIASAIFIGTEREVRLVTPLQWHEKRGVVELGIMLNAPLELTYSCYKGKELHCGVCATCVSRIQAFKDNGKIDPVDYDADIDWGSLENTIDLGGE